MTRKILFILALLLFLPAAARAADFTATVDNDHIAAGQSITLQLTLSDTKAKDDPDLGELKKSFTVISEGQTSSTSIVNGDVSTSVGWQLTLIPKQTGRTIIPPVTIRTADGVLGTKAIAVDVGDGTGQPSSAGNQSVTITAKAATDHPYQGQPVLYTVKITARSNVSNLSLGDLDVDNAVVEKPEKPEITTALENGVPVKVFTFRYVITPVKPGRISIPPVTLQGQIANHDEDSPFDILSRGLSDPFGMFQGQQQGRQSPFPNFGFSLVQMFKPFSIASNSTTLDVKPPAAEMDPWLPLTSLQIQESMDSSQQAKVGEPLTRKITMMAEGAAGSQLPSLRPQQNEADFRVYADKPLTGEDIDKETGAVSGWRRENYSIIPQKPGKLTLPQMSVKWWDTANNRLMATTVPARTIDVLPGAAASPPPPAPAAPAPPPVAAPQPVQPEAQAAPTPAHAAAGSATLYSVIVALVAGLLLAIFWVLNLQRTVNRLAAVRTDDSAQKPRKEPERKTTGTAALDAVNTPAELNAFLQSYANENWGTPKNASPEAIFAALGGGAGVDPGDAEAVARGIAGALYAGKTADLADLKQRCGRIITAARRRGNDNAGPAEKLPKLNPS